MVRQCPSIRSAPSRQAVAGHATGERDHDADGAEPVTEPTQAGGWGCSSEDTDTPCLWFFLPLPHPLGLPEGWTLQRALPLVELLHARRPNLGVATSIRIHQMEPSVQPVLREMADLQLYAAGVMAEAPATASGSADVEQLLEVTDQDLSSLQTVRTVAEVAVPGFTDDNFDDVVRALDLAIEHVRFVQRAVAVATERAVRLLARATLPPVIPVYFGIFHGKPTVADEPQKPEVRSMVELLVPNPAPPDSLGIRPQTFDTPMLDRVSHFLEGFLRRQAFDTYSDLRREAMVQRGFDGNTRMAVVALAAAGEVLLDTALLHMLWEEHTAPVVAAAHFDRSEGHTRRVARNFPLRLGGGWDQASRTPGGRYLRDIVRLRHRVVHTGHEPTASELEAAWSALFELEEYLGDRLTVGANLKRYTRTAMAWMAETGLRRRDRWTKHVQRLVEDPNEPNWVDTFNRWRLHVDRALEPDAGPPGSDPDQLLLYAERVDDGSIRWIIHDHATANAAIVDPHLVCGQEEIRRISELVDPLCSTDPASGRAGVVLEAPVPAGVAWQADHDIFPEFALFPPTATRPPKPR